MCDRPVKRNLKTRLQSIPKWLTGFEVAAITRGKYWHNPNSFGWILSGRFRLLSHACSHKECKLCLTTAAPEPISVAIAGNAVTHLFAQLCIISARYQRYRTYNRRTSYGIKNAIRGPYQLFFCFSKFPFGNSVSTRPVHFWGYLYFNIF